MNLRRIRWIGVMLVLGGAPLIGSWRSETIVQSATADPSATGAPTGIPATPIPIELRMERLQASVDAFDSLVEVQTNSFDSTVARLESNLNLLLAFVAIISVIVGLIGLGFVRIWIRQAVEQQLSGAARAELDRALTQELDRIRTEWEPRFNALYEEYRDLVKRDNKE